MVNKGIPEAFLNFIDGWAWLENNLDLAQKLVYETNLSNENKSRLQFASGAKMLNQAMQ